jgi:hypothetical protein
MILCLLQIQAQDTIICEVPRFRIGIEAGIHGCFDGGINKPDMIRENKSYYQDEDYDYHCGFIFPEQDFGFFSFGIKAEYTLSKRFVMATGVRFSFFEAKLVSDRNYFLWKISETETGMNCAKINSISQKNYYIGIPLEIKFFPRERDYFGRQYFIFGTTFNFLVASNHAVTFINEKMNKYTSNVLEQIGTPTFFHANIYWGVGLKLGKPKYPFGTIEALFPMFTIERPQEGSFVRMGIVGFGFKTTLLIPTIRKHQLIYTVID